MEPHAKRLSGIRSWARLRSMNRKLLGWGGVCLLFAIVTYGVYFWSMQSGIDSLRESGKQRLAVYVSSLDSVLGKYDYLPRTLEHNKDVFSLLQHPQDTALLASVNQFLQQVNDQAQSNTIYLLDMNGVTLASSNWDKPTSFVGVDLAFRPYVQDALHLHPGRFYAIGTTSNEAGYYFSHGIYRNGQIMGVATVKVSLEKLEQTWSQGVDTVLLIDENKVIFLSSLGALKYKTLGKLPQQTIDHLNATRQYHLQRLDPIHVTESALFADDTRVVSIQGAGLADRSAPITRAALLTQGASVLQPNWRFLLLSDLSRVEKSARAASAFAAVMFGFLLFFVLYLRQRQLAIVQSLHAKEALQHAYDNLELMVAERTSELHATAQELTRQIADRRQAQQALQTTQDELIQAGKMAVLGQMSAGITHELNQPLTALRTMSDNALVLLERGYLDDTRANLATISQLVDRMGTITRQLKVFARKSTSTLTVVSIRGAIQNALFLVERRLQLEKVTFRQSMPHGDVHAIGDPNRLEQVLVNLFNNALDAMAHRASPCLAIHVHQHAARVFITVKDNGAGLSDDVLPHLFEPFFTTKAQGAGLGLGLVISAEIVREFGGVLSGKNAPEGGAVFTVALAAARPEVHHA